MTDLSHLAALSRAFAVLTPGPDRAAGMARRLDALLVLEALAEASPRADGGRLHLRLMDWLCRWIRTESPVAAARRWPLAPPVDLRGIRDRRARPREQAFHIARLVGPWGEGAGRGNLADWIAALPPPRADVQLALTILGRRGPAQRAVEWAGDAPAVPPRGEVLHSPASRAWGCWPQDRDAALPVGAWQGRWVPDLSGTNLQRHDLRGAHLAGADLSGAALEGAELALADLAQARLIEARLDGAALCEADLRGACLDGASAQRADFTLADLRAADLGGAGLQEACLENARIGGACFAGALLDGADLLGIPPAQIAATDLSPDQIAAARPVRPGPALASGHVAGGWRLPPLPG